MTGTADLVLRYAERFHDRYLREHGVASALGLWLLLALVAPAAEGEVRRELEEHLGCDADEASRRAGALLASPHPAVRAAVAVRATQGFVNDRFRQWDESLIAEVETGPMPSQQEADHWAARNTGGMIDRFPVTIQPDEAMVLASALATDVSWIEPFTDVDSSELGGEFGRQVHHALAAPQAHTQFLVDTDNAGIVAVHVAHAAAGLEVLSVLADTEIDSSRVHSAALEVAARIEAVRNGHGVVDVFELPLGEGAAWFIEERVIEAHAFTDQRAVFQTYLAPWSAQSDHDLAEAPGVDTACAMLNDFLLPAAQPGLFEARQSAVADYRREGFKAAAVTAFAMRAGSAMSPPRTITQRDVTVRFNRPYAVLALAERSVIDPEDPWALIDVDEQAWAGMPVFGAWITEPAVG
jgi:hypothetical protein